MNPKDREVLDQYLQIDPESLSVYELDFIRARRSYLNKTQRKEYENVIKYRDEEVSKSQEDTEA